MQPYVRAGQNAAKALGIRVTSLSGHTLGEIDEALEQISNDRPDALYVVPTGAVWASMRRIVAFATQQRLPTDASVSALSGCGLWLPQLR